ncbi:IQ and ubiquitin-like domain-containing protein [Agrilus planipennis]|nr:IQ and ubiquitin-like domain-containing protein [Agrilus planipennis]
MKEDYEMKKEEEFFLTIGTPLEWNSNYRNLYVQMDTLETQKARQYHDLFRTLRDHDLCKERRLNALFNVKKQLQDQDHNCQLSNEIVELIDRCCVLISRGFEYKQLEMLQKRIEHLLMKHLNQRECNEGITNRLVRVKEKVMHQDLFLCQRCQKLKSHNEFPIDSRTKLLRICNSCIWIDKVQQPPINMAPYAYILKCIRREERRKGAQSSVAFVLGNEDIQYIVDHIWHGHSALSECDDIHALRLARWEKDKEWSPWNCVLLTTEEIRNHNQLEKFEGAYEYEFIEKVQHKHLDGKVYFKKAYKYGNTVKYGVDWSKIEGHIDFVAVNSKVRIPPTCH